MYSLLITIIVLVGIHFSYKYLERRITFVSNIIESKSKDRYNDMVNELPSIQTKVMRINPNLDKGDCNHEDLKRKEELESFLDELKQNTSS